MSEFARTDSYRESLAAFGAELSRWPEERAHGAREAILRDPKLRRAFEVERALDRELAGSREAFDREFQGSPSLARIRVGTMRRLPKRTLGRVGWQRVAAAVLMAGMLGSAMDLFLGQPVADPVEIAMLDPLYSLDESEPQ